MAIQGKHGGTWKTARINLKYNGVWREGNTTWVKTNGAWHAMVPRGVILMYYADVSTIPEGIICDGNNGTPNLIDSYLGASSTTLRYIPAENSSAQYHKHPDINFYTSTYNHPFWEGAGLGFSDDCWTDVWGHNHSVLYNFHTSSAILENGGAVPIIYSNKIHRNCIIIREKTSIPAGFVAWLYQTIRFTLAGGYISGSKTHTHSYNCNISTYSVSYNRVILHAGDKSRWHQIHSHSMSPPACSSVLNVSKTQDTPLYGTRLTENSIWWDELPQGSIVLFIGDTVPPGWTKLTYNNCLLCLDGTTNTSTTHSHTIPSFTTGEVSSNYTKPFFAGTSGRIIANHTHTVDGQTTDTVANYIPPRTELPLIKKL